MRPLYLDMDTEAALIEALNAMDAAWREDYASPIDAAIVLLPSWLAEQEDAEDDDDAHARPLDFNED